MLQPDYILIYFDSALSNFRQIFQSHTILL